MCECTERYHRCMTNTAVLGAGGVVFLGQRSDAQDQLKVLLLQYANGGWTFPKGHIEEGETTNITAVREVLEETGVHAQILAEIGHTAYTNNKGIARQIFWFAMQASDTNVALESIFDEGGFFALDQAYHLLSYEEDRQLLARALAAWSQ